MAAPIKTYRTRVSGLWSPRHTILDEEDNVLGVLTVTRNRWGLVVHGEYRPEKGEVLTFRRDPGLLRAQFSVWTDGPEWLGSSLRWSVAKRQIDVWTGGKPYRMVPTGGIGRGWRLVASKTGESARIVPKALGRSSTMQVFRKLDFELLLFAYFLGSMVLTESAFPTTLDSPQRGATVGATPSKA
ncbi:MAG: hypothetical protein GY711_32180 [bacterium]|nr:hypothetical protein [bacterium]